MGQDRNRQASPSYPFRSSDASGFGNRWSKATLVPTIADNAGAAVPFRYGATLQ
jgi:hypothetical protein